MALRPCSRSLRFGLWVAVATGCAPEHASDGGVDPAVLFGDGIETIRIEVDYMPGAEPYTGSAGNHPDVWTLFDDNVHRLFEGSNKTISFPTALDDMERLGAAEAESYSVDDLLELAAAHRDLEVASGEATFYFVWVDGYYEDEDGVQDSVLGVSIGRTGVVAMFKPVIATTGSASFVSRFSEQTTLIHEFGHAVGLVDNGIPLSTDHLDEENGSHCTNPECVMYYALESRADLVRFARMLEASGQTVVFDADCLSDVDTLVGD